MRIALAELAPVPREVERNSERVIDLVGRIEADLLVFPELFLSGYDVGDAFHGLALDRAGLASHPIARAATARKRSIVVGAPVRPAGRAGEVENAAILFPGDGGPPRVQVKRYLPTYGPFEEGAIFSPTDRSDPVSLGSTLTGLEICYDAFFPEVSRELALAGAELLLVISASPITSRRLFEKVLPARAVENAAPVVYVNRVGVEGPLVFGGGSGVWDARGEPIAVARATLDVGAPEEWIGVAEVDLSDAARWRPFRPVLRDRHARPSHHAAASTS